MLRDGLNLNVSEIQEVFAVCQIDPLLFWTKLECQ